MKQRDIYGSEIISIHDETLSFAKTSFAKQPIGLIVAKSVSYNGVQWINSENYRRKKGSDKIWIKIA